MDYLGRWLALKFLRKEKAMLFHNHELVEQAYREGSKSKDAFALRLPVIDEGSTVQTHEDTSLGSVHAGSEPVAGKAEQAKLQGFTGSLCGGCGSFKMKRNGSCEICLDCGATSGGRWG